MNVTFYRSVIDSLRYLVYTRPDIVFAVGFLTRFMEAPTSDHLAAVKHLLRYMPEHCTTGVCIVTATSRH